MDRDPVFPAWLVAGFLNAGCVQKSGDGRLLAFSYVSRDDAEAAKAKLEQSTIRCGVEIEEPQEQAAGG